MKAVQFAEHGDRDVIEYDRFPDPETDRAHEMIENREGFGKGVVIPDSEL